MEAKQRPQIEVSIPDMVSIVNAWIAILNDKERVCAELLEALERAVRVMQDQNIDESLAGEFEQFTDAIAKAKGEK